MYKCLNCGKEVEIKYIKEKIRCPYCGYRIITKDTPKTATNVKSM